jgi:hypothetical protein
MEVSAWTNMQKKTSLVMPSFRIDGEKSTKKSPSRIWWTTQAEIRRDLKRSAPVENRLKETTTISSG